jgi:hypothetical protein
VETALQGQSHLGLEEIGRAWMRKKGDVISLC